MRARERVSREARALARGARARGAAGRRQRGDDVPLGRGARRRDVEGFATRLLERGVLVAPGSFLGAVGRGLRPVRARAHRSTNARRAASILEVRSDGPTAAGSAIERRCLRRGAASLRGRAGRGGDPPARPRRGPRRRARDGGWVVNEWVKKAILLYFKLRKVEPMEAGALHFLDKIPVKTDYADRGVRVVRPGSRATGRSCPRACILMPGFVNIGAWVGPADDGRHVGDGRLVRPDRRRRAPRRRRRHRRRARAAAGAAGDRRGRRLHRLPLPSSPRACASAPGRCWPRTSR